MASSSRSTGVPRYDARVLLNSQPVIVSVIDPQTHQIQFQNDTGLKKFGDIGGFSCYEKIAGCQSPCSFCRMPEALTTDSVVSNEVALPGNQYLLVHWSKALTTDGPTSSKPSPISRITNGPNRRFIMHRKWKLSDGWREALRMTSIIS